MKGDQIVVHLKDGRKFTVEADKGGQRLTLGSLNGREQMLEVTVLNRAGNEAQRHAFARSEVVAVEDHRKET